MVYQVWILGPGDVPTAAHELWEDDRMELLVRKFCGHFFPESEVSFLSQNSDITCANTVICVRQSFSLTPR